MFTLGLALGGIASALSAQRVRFLDALTFVAAALVILTLPSIPQGPPTKMHRVLA